jgi:PelA/Pel-15E family pectate lyase
MNQKISRLMALFVALATCPSTPVEAMPKDAQFANESEAKVVAAAKKKQYQPIDVSAFHDGIEHYQLEAVDLSYPRYSTNQIVEIAENLILYQSADGGWPKNLDWLRVVTVDEAIKEMQPRLALGSTLDNRNIQPQIRYLAQAFQQTGLARYRAAAERGIDYILSSQRDSGGWRGADVDAITFNDDVSVGALELLREVATGKSPFEWVAAKQRERAAAATRKGLECILNTQFKHKGKLTVWGQQHDHNTLKPAGARKWELPSLCAWESVGVVEFLMSYEQPDARIRDAIQSAVKWFDDAKIKGLRIERRPLAKPYRVNRRIVASDVVEVSDASAPPIWARFYDLENMKPMFVQRTGEILARFDQIVEERRDGYDWYGYWPAKLLQEKYPAWQKKWAPDANVLKR